MSPAELDAAIGALERQLASVPADAPLHASLETVACLRDELAALRHELTLARADAHEERHRYRAYFEFAADGFLVTDESGIIRDANQTAALTLHVPRRYLPGKALALFVDEADRPRYWGIIRQLHHGLEPRDWSFTLVARGGDRYRINAQIAVERDHAGVAQGLRWLIRSQDAAPHDVEVALTRRPWMAADSAPTVPASADRSRRVVVAVADAGARERLEGWLGRHWEVHQCATADAALAAAFEAPTHLVIADVELDRAGTTVATLRADARTRELPVVGYARNRSPSIAWASQLLDDVAEEPLTEGELVARVAVRLDAGRVRREDNARVNLLIEAGAALSAELDVDATLREVARLAVPAAADWCMVDLVNEHGQLRRVATARSSRVAGRDADVIVVTGAADPAAPLVAARVAAGRGPALAPEGGLVPEQGSRAATRMRADLGGIAADSYVCVPLARGDRTFGALTLATVGSGRAYGRGDLPFAEELGRRVALAVDNARLYERALAAGQAADRARRDAEGANQAKTDFLATMSHELRTPLNAIAGYTQLLEMELRGPLTPAQREDLGRIRRSQQHLLGLIEDVLGYASLDAGHLSMRLERVNVTEVLRDVRELVQTQADAKSLAFECQCPPGDSAVLADRGRLVQIVSNLVANAVKFTAPGGRVWCAARVTDDDVRVSIADTGRGIPPAMQERVFHPFVQADAALNREEQGTGLGLAISRALARAMGGDITVDSVEGEGSTFTVCLPRPAG